MCLQGTKNALNQQARPWVTLQQLDQSEQILDILGCRLLVTIGEARRDVVRPVATQNVKEQLLSALLLRCSCLLSLTWHPVILTVRTSGVLKEQNVKRWLVNCILQCTGKGLQLNASNAHWCMHKKGTIQDLLLNCRCMPHDIAATLPC